MLAVHHPDLLLHDPQQVFFKGRFMPHWDQPERCRIFLEVLKGRRDEIVVAPDAGLEPITAVHDAAYVAFLQTAWDRWHALPDAGEQAIPNVHPTHRMNRMPADVLGQLGWYSNSTSCPITEHTWRSAQASAHAAVHAARLLAEGQCKTVYALCRPPGHHAYRDLMSGVCYLNNAAIAAEILAKRGGRVAIFDIDVHHGNGTQAIFWTRPDVLYVSIHIDPMLSAPYYAGHADEVGEGAGRGFNRNFPLPWATSDAVFLEQVVKALAEVQRFGPAALVLSLGFDASEHETAPTFRVSIKGFAETAARISRLGLPTALIQEGGYLNPHLADNLRAFLRGFELQESETY
jgi:acetoin utilization deacetylase AcuC-like enzyme